MAEARFGAAPQKDAYCGVLAIADRILDAAAAVLIGRQVLLADDFIQQDLERWNDEFMSVVKTGRELWVSPKLGSNGLACAQCHLNAANTHPETYPKFRQQLGRVIALREMIKWCLLKPLESKPLKRDDPRLVAIESSINYERRGVALAPEKHQGSQRNSVAWRVVGLASQLAPSRTRTTTSARRRDRSSSSACSSFVLGEKDQAPQCLDG